MEFVGMIVYRLGTRPSPSKIDAITQLSRPNTVEEDMGVKSDARNKVLLVAVDKASKFMFASPSPRKKHS